MTTEQMKVALKKSYPSTNWAMKVDKMSDKQVFATYTRLQNSKKL